MIAFASVVFTTVVCPLLSAAVFALSRYAESRGDHLTDSSTWRRLGVHLFSRCEGHERHWWWRRYYR